MKTNTCLTFIANGDVDTSPLFPTGATVAVSRSETGDYLVAECIGKLYVIDGLDSLADMVSACAEQVTSFDWIELSGDVCEYLGQILFSDDHLLHLFKKCDQATAAWLIAAYINERLGICLAPGLGDKAMDSIADAWWDSFSGKEAE